MTGHSQLFKKWLHALLQASEGKDPGLCSSCGATTVRSVFGGDPKTRIGFGWIWCDTCLRGIRMSRMAIPTTVELIPFELEAAQWPVSVPNFQEVKS
jgi:hypothetical protein